MRFFLIVSDSDDSDDSDDDEENGESADDDGDDGVDDDGAQVINETKENKVEKTECTPKPKHQILSADDIITSRILTDEDFEAIRKRQAEKQVSR